MAAKEILCIICIGLGNQAPTTDFCDFAAKVITGPHRDSFRPSRNDSRGSKNLQAAIQEKHRRCVETENRK